MIHLIIILFINSILVSFLINVKHSFYLLTYSRTYMLRKKKLGVTTRKKVYENDGIVEDAIGYQVKWLRKNLFFPVQGSKCSYWY